MADQTIEELRAKVSLGSMLIEMLEQEDDPRAPAAIEALREQQQGLKALIEAAKPIPIVVGCEPATLSARAQGSPARQQSEEDVQVVEMVSEDDGNITLTLQY